MNEKWMYKDAKIIANVVKRYQGYSIEQLESLLKSLRNKTEDYIPALRQDIERILKRLKQYEYIKKYCPKTYKRITEVLNNEVCR